MMETVLVRNYARDVLDPKYDTAYHVVQEGPALAGFFGSMKICPA